MWKIPHWKRDVMGALREQPRLAAALISAEDNSEINWKNQSCFQILSNDRMGILSLGECLFWLAHPRGLCQLLVRTGSRLWLVVFLPPRRRLPPQSLTCPT